MTLVLLSQAEADHNIIVGKLQQADPLPFREPHLQDRQGLSPLQGRPQASDLLVGVPLGTGSQGGAGMDRAMALQEAEAEGAPQEEQDVTITLKHM